ncbi:MAG: hypothetical protein IJT25_00965 [Clostridia bacterium]|nr:hypothetical protein [Clostridia bacterium]
MNKIVNIKLIEHYIEEKKLNKTSFCKKCKVSACTFNKIIKNETNFRINALFKIAREMEINVFDLFI